MARLSAILLLINLEFCALHIPETHSPAYAPTIIVSPTSTQVTQLVVEYDSLQKRSDELSQVISSDERQVDGARVEILGVISSFKPFLAQDFQSAKIGQVKVPINVYDGDEWLRNIDSSLAKFKTCKEQAASKGESRSRCAWHKHRIKRALFPEELNNNYANLKTWLQFYKWQTVANSIQDSDSAERLADDIFREMYIIAVQSANGIYTDNDRQILQNRFDSYRQVVRAVNEKWSLIPHVDKVLPLQDNVLFPKNASDTIWRMKYLESDLTVDLLTLKKDIVTEERAICSEYKKYKKSILQGVGQEHDEVTAKAEILCSILVSRDSLQNLIRDTNLSSKLFSAIPYSEITLLRESDKKYCSLTHDSRITPIFEKADQTIQDICSKQE